MQLFILPNHRFATESPSLHCSRYKQPYCYHFKHASCEGPRDLLSKSKKKCAALWSMSLVSTLMRLPMPANLKIKMAKSFSSNNCFLLWVHAWGSAEQGSHRVLHTGSITFWWEVENTHLQRVSIPILLREEWLLKKLRVIALTKIKICITGSLSSLFNTAQQLRYLWWLSNCLA